jgi:glycerate 2-kinase
MASRPWVRNGESLCSRGWVQGRRQVLTLLEDVLAAADPGLAVRRELVRDGSALFIGGRKYPVTPGRVHFLGVGKASAPIAEAVEEVLGDWLHGGVLVVKRGQAARVQKLRVLEGDHPIPTEASRAAAVALIAYAQRQVGPGDLVLCGITGGSSSLASLPPPGVPWEAKVALHRVLVLSGMPINEINAVRKHVSGIKGGRLAAAMPAARIVNLTVSDVAGDAPDLVTDLTVEDTTSPGDAREVLRRYGLWDQVDSEIRRHLSESAEDAVHLPHVVATRMMITGTDLADYVARRAEDLLPGVPVTVFSTSLSGEAREVGRVLGAYARERVLRREPQVAVLCGGETTVAVDAAGLGEGGPNLELALAFGIEVTDVPRVALVSVDTDGSDGSTDMAGGLVDGYTVADSLRARQALESHRTRALAEEWGFGVYTGQTRTNVNDVTLIVTA